MNKVNSYTILLILFLSSTTFSQIWIVKNVSNIFPDDCYVSLGNKYGIACCFPERYIERQKIDEWDDDALCYLLYPVHTLVMNNDTKTEKKSKKRKSRKKRADQKNGKADSLQANEAPKWKFNTEDSLTLTENGQIIYKYEEILLYKTYEPLLEKDITSYRPFQLFKPATTVKPVQKNQ